MNCFSHGLPYLHDPYFLAGVCLPDWLSGADRRSKVREAPAALLREDEEAWVATTAQGIVRHHREDHWFHSTTAFTELNGEFTAAMRRRMREGKASRPSFAAHILIEMLLDSFLMKLHPGKLEEFYACLDEVDGRALEDIVNRISPHPTDRLADYLQHFRTEKYIFDYAEDNSLVYRLNGVLQEIGLQTVGAEVVEWLPEARGRIDDLASELLPPGRVSI